MIVWHPSMLADEDRESFQRWFDYQINAAVAEEREACAKLAESHRAVDKYRQEYGWPYAQREIALLIRARGQEETPHA